MGDIPDDLMIPFIICGEKSVELLNGWRLLVRPSQARCLWLYSVFKRTRFHLRPSRQVKSNRTALHVDDRQLSSLGKKHALARPQSCVFPARTQGIALRSARCVFGGGRSVGDDLFPRLPSTPRRDFGFRCYETGAPRADR